ncbi:MAG TPA: hypothetical protein VLJ11_08660 [Bryobacteraceae bacterium]|nr:hypothetical protein [Bryobacteraceae bacterium]
MIWKTLLGMELDAWTLTAAPIVGSADLTFHLTTTYNGFHNDSAAAVNALNYAQADGPGPTGTKANQASTFHRK